MMFITENRAVNPLLKLEITLKAWAVVAGGLIMLGALSSTAMAADPLVLQNRETAVIDGRCAALGAQPKACRPRL